MVLQRRAVLGEIQAQSQVEPHAIRLGEEGQAPNKVECQAPNKVEVIR
jgi:hypothetical protein